MAGNKNSGRTKVLPLDAKLLSLYLKPNIKTQFKLYCFSENTTMSDQARQLIEEWIKEQDDLKNLR